MTVGPSTLHQEVAHAGVAHLRDRAAPDRLAGGTFAGYEAEVTHELARALEPPDVTDLDDERRRGHEIDAAQHLQRLDERSEERRVGKERRSRWSPYH